MDVLWPLSAFFAQWGAFVIAKSSSSKALICDCSSCMLLALSLFLVPKMGHHEKEPAQEGSVLEPFSAGVNFTRNMHFVRRQSILDCAKHRKTFSRTRHSRQFQLDSTQPRGMGSAK